jgi:hypothetical protein
MTMNFKENLIIVASAILAGVLVMATGLIVMCRMDTASAQTPAQTETAAPSQDLYGEEASQPQAALPATIPERKQNEVTVQFNWTIPPNLMRQARRALAALGPMDGTGNSPANRAFADFAQELKNEPLDLTIPDINDLEFWNCETDYCD